MSTARANQLIEAGIWLRLSGDPKGAQRLFDQALAMDPDNPRARELFDLPPAAAAAPAPAPEPIEAVEVEVKEFTPEATSAWDWKSNPGVHLDTIRPNVSAPMDLLAADLPASPAASGEVLQEEVLTLLRGAKDLLELDDHSGAMDLIAKAEELAPHEPEVASMRAHSERVLQAMYESKLGPLEATPRVKMKEDEIIWLNLDHRAGFVLAQIDGTVSFEDLFAVSGMSRLDTARILAQLVTEGVIAG